MLDIDEFTALDGKPDHTALGRINREEFAIVLPERAPLLLPVSR